MEFETFSKKLRLLVPFPYIPTFAIHALKQGENEIASAALTALIKHTKGFDKDIGDGLVFELLRNDEDGTFECHVVLLEELEVYKYDSLKREDAE